MCTKEGPLTLCDLNCTVLLSDRLQYEWHARRAAFLDKADTALLDWPHVPADLIFILVGVLPMVVASGRTCWTVRKPRQGIRLSTGAV